MLRALALLTLLMGCQERTEMIVGVATDLRAMGDIDLVRLIASRNGTPVVQTDWPLGDAPGTAGMFELPGSFGLYSADGSETAIEISVKGYKAKNIVIDREARVSLLSGKTLFMRMSITGACNVGNGPKCAADESCVEGCCQKRDIDAHRLPKFRNELVKKTECTSGTRYIVSSTGDPMESLGDSCPNGGECHEGTCWTPGSGADSCNSADLGGDGG